MVSGEQQLESLVRRYEHRVGFFARRVQRSYRLDGSARDELLSAGYFGLFKALRDRREDAGERELSAYVSRRIHGAVLDAARVCLSQASCAATGGTHGDGDEMRRVERRLPASGLDGSADEGADAIAARVLQRSAIRLALGQLDAGDRRLLVAYMQGSSLAEIARDEGLALGTVQVRFRRLARRLRARAPRLRHLLLDREPQ